jgi:site-specific DNA-cytosine methylase
MNLTDKKMELYTVNFCCGIGGQDLGFEQSEHEYKGIKGKFKTLVGYDVDPVACKNFEINTGNRAICADLFTREQYILFHGKEPGPEWEELTAIKIREQCGKTPDVVIMSPPCKGFSRLLPKKTAQLPKYQALNQLPERVFDLVLEAWFDDFPAVLLMENVPGIRDRDRGQKVLKKIKAKLALKGYVFYEDLYDCGDWGGLGQHRVRYLLIARLPSKVPDFIFQPPELPLKSIGDILEPLPMPGNIEKGGKMHRIPNLAWRTWERLALIPAGKDWRALENFGREQWKGAWKIVRWDEAAHAVTSSTKGVGQSTGVSAVADPRLEFVQGYGNKYRVVSADEPSPTVTGSRLGSGAPIYADPKVPEYANLCKVADWNEPGPTITGGNGPTNGAVSVSDPRIDKVHFNHCFRVTDWDTAAGTITSGTGPTNGGTIVADPRLNKREGRYPGTYKVIPWEEPSSTVLGQTDIQTGAQVVADRRIRCESRPGLYGIADWDKPINTITGNMSVSSSNSVAVVADPRKWSGAGNYGVMNWDEPAKTVTASGDIHAGTSAVADPRIPNPDDRGIYIIIAADGTWHRPITTYEMAMLQGFPRTMRDGTPFELIDCSDGKAREYIGNAVPVQTAAAIGVSLLEALMPNLLGEIHWGFSNLNIWVSPKEEQDRRYFDENSN